MNLIRFFLSVLVSLFLSTTAFAETPVTTAPIELTADASQAQSDLQMVSDFEGEEGFVNHLKGTSGSWNMDPSDINNSYCDEDIVEMPGLDGTPTKVLRLSYSVESDRPSQNGFWTKLEKFDAEGFDHLAMDVKGDVDEGFTERFRLELKKCKNGNCTGDEKVDEVIKGTAVIPVSSEWQTVQIPLNKMTGVIDFANPEAWHNPSVARKDLDQLVFVFRDRHVTKKQGIVYLDNIRFLKTGNPGPTAIDKPKRFKEKTSTRIEGLEFARFLSKRLGGFPEKTVVKKEFSQDDREFLMEIAKDTWKFFDHIVDQEHGLVLDTIQLAPKGDVALEEGSWIGDYTNVTNIGVYLMCLVSAYDLGLITQEDAVARVNKTLDTLEKLEYHESGFPYNYYDTTTAERTEYFVSLVDSGWYLAGLYIVKNAFPEALAERTQKLIDRGHLGFFYDDVERQFFHGYYDHLKVYSDYHYGIFYSEPRATSYIAIARGEVPSEHWFEGLMRTFPETVVWQMQKPVNRIPKEAMGHTYSAGYYEWKDLKYIPSWGGSAFEALMPTMLLDEKKLAPKGLGLNDSNHVQGQIRYAMEELGYPVWGMSPSSVPEGGYSEYGAKPFGSKGYKPGVVTPHASVLALEFAPKEVIANLRKLIELYDVYGEYGFYDAVTVETGLVARKYLALDQGMIFVALNNYLNDGAIRKRFQADPVLQKAEELLTSETFFDEVPASDKKPEPEVSSASV